MFERFQWFLFLQSSSCAFFIWIYLLLPETARIKKKRLAKNPMLNWIIPLNTALVPGTRRNKLGTSLLIIIGIPEHPNKKKVRESSSIKSRRSVTIKLFIKKTINENNIGILTRTSIGARKNQRILFTPVLW